MSLLYVTENGAKVGVSNGKITVLHTNGTTDELPKETVTGISVFGQVQLTAALIRFCLQRGIRISFLSQNGNYYGSLSPTEHMNAERVKQQVYLSDDEEFSMKLAKKLIHAKINNQCVVARRYWTSGAHEPQDELMQQLMVEKKKVLQAKERNELLGIEGSAARSYFSILGEIVSSEFCFSGRNRQPATDPINAMLNYGYSMLQKEIQGEIENRGLNAYIGFLHQERLGHSALASDLIEEWRAPIIDSVVLRLVCGNEISEDAFYYEDGACRMTEDGMKILVRKIEMKMAEEMGYLSYINRQVSFRSALWHQAELLTRAIEEADAEKYQPIFIR